MPTKADVPALRISSYMNLEQAMEEVRTYLEASKNRFEIQADLSTTTASTTGQLSMQGTLADRLADISRRLGEIEPNSKFGAPGIFLKRILKKLIGWHAKPAQEFDRTAVEAFRQIRHDMLQLQDQVAVLSKRMDHDHQSPPGSVGTLATSANASQTNQDELLRSVLVLFRTLIDKPAVRVALQSERPELLRKVESLLTSAEAEFSNESHRTRSS